MPGRGRRGAPRFDAAEELVRRAAGARASTSCIDDREARPGVKFADADLLGVPVQVIVGAKGLARGVVERKVARDGRARRDRGRRRRLHVLAGRVVTPSPVTPPVVPMLAKLARELPPAGDVILRAEVGRLPLHRVPRRRRPRLCRAATRSRSLRYFPELREPLLRAAARAVSCSTARSSIATTSGLDFDALAAAPAPGRVARAEARGRDPRRRSSRSTCSPSATSRCASSRSASAGPRLERVLARARRRRSTSRPRRTTATSRPSGSRVRGRGLRRRRRQAARRHRTTRASARCSR